jgi:hypothetical protein
MNMHASCPRCGAFVQPDWPTCRICGFDRQQAETAAPPMRRRPPRHHFNVVEVVGALATLVLLIAIGWGVLRGGGYLWDHRDGPVERQQFVSVEH